MKNKIIVLVDFSKESENVILYALEFAYIHKKNVEVVFVQDQSIDNISFNHFEFRNRFVSDLVKKCDLKDLEVNIVMYSIVIDIKHIQEKLRTLYTLIVGVKLKNDLEEFYNDTSIVDSLACPVIVVSTFSKREPINELLFVCNYNNAEKNLIKIWNNFSALYNGITNHIIFKIGSNEKSIAIQDIFDKIFVDGDPDLSFKLSMFEEDKFDEKLDEYINSNKIEMAVTV